MKPHSLLSLFLLLLFLPSFYLNAQSTQVELMAANTNWHQGEFVGHGFMCLIVSTASGLREEYYGFYPKEGGSKGFVGGSGVSNPQYRKNPTRFSRISVSIRKKITADQQRGIMRLINDWNTKNYDLNNQSCIDFVASVAKEINWQIPAGTDLPEAYLNHLKFLNELKFAIPGKFFGDTDMNGRKFQCSIDFKIISNELKGQWIWIADDSRGMLDNLNIKGDRSISFSVGSGQSLMNFKGSFAADLKSVSGSFSSQHGNGTWSMRKN